MRVTEFYLRESLLSKAMPKLTARCGVSVGFDSLIKNQSARLFIIGKIKPEIPRILLRVSLLRFEQIRGPRRKWTDFNDR